jgi:HK97 gp10 family phage protein
MAEISGFEDLAEQVEDIADKFESMADKRGRESARKAIKKGVTDAMNESIVPEANELAPEGDWDDHHNPPGNDREGENATPGHLKRSIDHESVGWTGDTYRHRYGSTSPYEYVRVQEFGTNKTNYTITPNGDYPLSFEVDGERIAVEMVVHPGVEGQHFMEQALEQNAKTIEGYVGNAMRDLLDDQF